MKKLVCLMLLALHCAALVSTPEKCANCAKQEDQTASVVIANFAAMAMNIINMVSNPKDAPTLAAGGCNIVASIANIAQQACKMVQSGQIAEDEVALVFYRKMLELGVHDQIAQQISRSSLTLASLDTK